MTDKQHDPAEVAGGESIVALVDAIMRHCLEQPHPNDRKRLTKMLDGEFAEQTAEIERLRTFVMRCHKSLAGKLYDPDMMDSLAREAAEVAKKVLEQNDRRPIKRQGFF